MRKMIIALSLLCGSYEGHSTPPETLTAEEAQAILRGDHQLPDDQGIAWKYTGEPNRGVYVGERDFSWFLDCQTSPQEIEVLLNLPNVEITRDDVRRDNFPIILQERIAELQQLSDEGKSFPEGQPELSVTYSVNGDTTLLSPVEDGFWGRMNFEAPFDSLGSTSRYSVSMKNARKILNSPEELEEDDRIVGED